MNSRPSGSTLLRGAEKGFVKRPVVDMPLSRTPEKWTFVCVPKVMGNIKAYCSFDGMTGKPSPAI
ncbi:hypothetical protein GCM10007989_12930 [Devosia pacifica]|uniref:Uncharacterized protein n=1 Tax=Devosia pacifica TaxID=1335967 RepID=A0A918VSK3_9HYPH|nr:hypothetical protein GCM10007989_12930 [Devosia pacifica]